MRKLKITWDEIIKVLEEKYSIKEIKGFYDSGGHDGMCELYQYPEYIEGDLNEAL